MQFTTWIEAAVPRVACARHGVKQLRVPWAEPGSQFTALFERRAIDLLRECSIHGGGGAVAHQLGRGLGDQGAGGQAGAGPPGPGGRGPDRGRDEKAIAKRHRCLTVGADLERNRVLYLADDRKQESLDGVRPTLTPAQRDGTTAVAMDMWEPSVQSTRAPLPGADDKIVFDKFPVVKPLDDAVDHVRRGEHRALKRAGETRLAGSKYLGLRRPADMTADQRAAFHALPREDLKVGRAWALKERFRTFWESRYPGAARPFFTHSCWDATQSRLQPMAAVAKVIQRHLPNLLTSLRRHLTNAGLEAVNAVIPWVKKTARGFRNAAPVKTAISFPCGGLDLYPHESR